MHTGLCVGTKAATIHIKAQPNTIGKHGYKEEQQRSKSAQGSPNIENKAKSQDDFGENEQEGSGMYKEFGK